MLWLAHAGDNHALLSPDMLAGAWHFDPLILSGLGMLALVYGLGVYRLWKRGGRHLTGAQIAAFIAGWLALFAALISPLDSLGEALFSGHMVQHLLLLLVAPPLLVWAAPVHVLLWGLPRAWRRPAGRWGKTFEQALSPAFAWLLHLAVMWLWHLPGWYEAALAHAEVHALEHVTFFGAGVLYWYGLRHTSYGLGVLSLFGTVIQSGLLGALLTFSPTVWYGAHQHSVGVWGFTALEDQQLAGLIMWIPGGLVYAGAAAWLFYRWLVWLEGRAAPRRPVLHPTPVALIKKEKHP